MDPDLLIAAAEGYGQSLIPALLDPVWEADALLRAPPGDLPPRILRRLADNCTLHHTAHRWIREARELGLAVLTPSQAAFPENMSAIPTRPRVLFARGDLSLLDHQQPGIAVVGSRTPTPYGVAATEDFASQLARAGVVIWSGLAYGIDAAAHRAAVAARAPTVAVLAGALDHIYPQTHLPLAESIVQQGGLLLSEAPPGTVARRGHFPRRNRILAAACRAVVVIEAGMTSGSLQTARCAAEIGTPVYAVPGPYRSPRSRGCHHLIGDGAQIAVDPEDLLRRLGVEQDLQQTAGNDLQLSADEAGLLRLLEQGPRPMDLLMRESRLEEECFVMTVHRLHRTGLVRRMPGDLLARVR